LTPKARVQTTLPSLTTATESPGTLAHSIICGTWAINSGDNTDDLFVCTGRSSVGRANAAAACFIKRRRLDDSFKGHLLFDLGYLRAHFFSGFNSQSTLTITQRPSNFETCR